MPSDCIECIGSSCQQQPDLPQRYRNVYTYIYYIRGTNDATYKNGRKTMRHSGQEFRNAPHIDKATRNTRKKVRQLFEETPQAFAVAAATEWNQEPAAAASTNRKYKDQTKRCGALRRKIVVHNGIYQAASFTFSGRALNSIPAAHSHTVCVCAMIKLRGLWLRVSLVESYVLHTISHCCCWCRSPPVYRAHTYWPWRVAGGPAAVVTCGAHSTPMGQKDGVQVSAKLQVKHALKE